MITKPGEKSEEQNKGIPPEEKINEESAFDNKKLFNLQKKQMATGTTTETHINWSKYNIILKNEKIPKQIKQVEELQKTIEGANNNTSSTIPLFAALIALSKEVVFTPEELENYEKNDILNAITRETEIGLNKKQKKLKEEYGKKLFDYVNEEIMPKELDKLKEELELAEKDYKDRIGHAKPSVLQGYEKDIEITKLMIEIKEYIEKQPDTNIFKDYTEFKKYFNGKSIQEKIQLGEENTGSLIKNEKELEKLNAEILNTCIDISSVDALRNYINNNKNLDERTKALLEYAVLHDEYFKVLQDFANTFGVNYKGKLLLPPLNDDQKTALEIAYWDKYSKEQTNPKGSEEAAVLALGVLTRNYFGLLEKGNADPKELENLENKISRMTVLLVAIKLKEDESLRNSLKNISPELSKKIDLLSGLTLTSEITNEVILATRDTLYASIHIQFMQSINKNISNQTPIAGLLNSPVQQNNSPINQEQNNGSINLRGLNNIEPASQPDKKSDLIAQIEDKKEFIKKLKEDLKNNKKGINKAESKEGVIPLEYYAIKDLNEKIKDEKENLKALKQQLKQERHTDRINNLVKYVNRIRTGIAVIFNKIRGEPHKILIPEGQLQGQQPQAAQTPIGQGGQPQIQGQGQQLVGEENNNPVEGQNKGEKQGQQLELLKIKKKIDLSKKYGQELNELREREKQGPLNKEQSERKKELLIKFTDPSVLEKEVEELLKEEQKQKQEHKEEQLEQNNNEEQKKEREQKQEEVQQEQLEQNNNEEQKKE